MMSGTFRDGLHMSPVLAEHMASLLLGEPGLELEWFAPERPPIAAFGSKQEALNSALDQYMASSYEHRLISAKMGFPRRLRPVGEQLIRDLHDLHDLHGGEDCAPNELVGLAQRTPSLEQRAAKLRDLGEYFRGLLAAHA